uniref:Uncharacterized protein n=1 Tax=Cannabis sativa TaxID=3483 RepID=A0A803R2U3_CANSA
MWMSRPLTLLSLRYGKRLIDCRNFPRGTISDMVKDVCRGISFVYNNIAYYGGDTDRYKVEHGDEGEENNNYGVSSLRKQEEEGEELTGHTTTEIKRWDQAQDFVSPLQTTQACNSTTSQSPTFRVILLVLSYYLHFFLSVVEGILPLYTYTYISVLFFKCVFLNIVIPHLLKYNYMHNVCTSYSSRYQFHIYRDAMLYSPL